MSTFSRKHYFEYFQGQGLGPLLSDESMSNTAYIKNTKDYLLFINCAITHRLIC